MSETTKGWVRDEIARLVAEGKLPPLPAPAPAPVPKPGKAA